MEKENDQIEIKDEDIKEDDFTPEQLEDVSIDWKAKAQELKGIAKRRATQLAKAKEKLKSIPEPKPEVKPQDKPDLQIKKPNEPDYAKLAYLKAEGVTHPDDQKLVQDEAERLKLPLTDVLQMEHIKTKLEVNKDVRNAQLGMPKGTKRSGGYTQQDVDYYLANPDKRPDDFELAKKVLKAKQEQEKKANQFSDIMFE